MEYALFGLGVAVILYTIIGGIRCLVEWIADVIDDLMWKRSLRKYRHKH